MTVQHIQSVLVLEQEHIENDLSCLGNEAKGDSSFHCSRLATLLSASGELTKARPERAPHLHS
jgi:hypothetical protein